MTLKIIGGLIFFLIAIRLYRFSWYIKRYLVPYNIKILSNEKKEGFYSLNFMVLFGKGYFKKEYLTVIGSLKSKNQFSTEMLKQMISLTEIKCLYGKNSDYEIEHKYSYFQSFKDASDKHHEGEYLVYYTVVDQAASDFIDEQMSEVSNNSSKYYKDGISKFENGDFKAAQESFSRAIELSPRDADIYFNRAGAKKKLGDHKGAIEDYTKVIELNPTDADAYCSRAYSRGSLKDYDGAVADALKAIEIKPDHSDAQKLLRFIEKNS